MLPTNEAETVALFKDAKELLRWKLKKWNGNFPDATIENHSGQILTVEFEYEAKNFERHGHDPSGCDLIICWHNNWKDAPLPVWEIRGCLPHFVIKLLTLLNTLSAQAEDLQSQNLALQESSQYEKETVTRLEDRITALQAKLELKEFSFDVELIKSEGVLRKIIIFLRDLKLLKRSPKIKRRFCSICGETLVPKCTYSPPVIYKGDDTVWQDGKVEYRCPVCGFLHVQDLQNSWMSSGEET